MAVCGKQCSAGQYLKSDCNCANCPVGSYTDTDNSVNNCRLCHHCHKDQHLQTKRNCSSHQNALCECISGFYCTILQYGSCSVCQKRQECQLGQGALNITDGKNTECEDCAQGYFSNVTDSYSSCRKHTDCGERELIKAGDRLTDNECGKVPCGHPHHHWILPAGLWAGLIISIIILAAYVYWKTRRQSRRTVSVSDDIVIRPGPVRAPDILPPASELYKSECTETQPFFCAEKQTSSMSCDCREVSIGAGHNAPLVSACDCTLECDGATSPVISPNSPLRLTPVAVACGPAADSIGCSVCHSEPQEDEWNGA